MNKSYLHELLHSAGVSVNGNNPWDIKVYNDKFYTEALPEGTLGVGTAYIRKWWECSQLDEFCFRVLASNIDQKIKSNWRLLTEAILARIFNRQTRKLAVKNGQRHYDIGNDLFTQMLDQRMTYTCGYWKNATTLDQAQEHKLDLTCRKLNLQPGMHVLDIGCGWGSFAKFAAENYDVQVTGITISVDQIDLGKALCADLPVKLELRDYRELDGRYDRIVSLGMFEHVGYKNYTDFMRIAHRCLSDDGLFLLHTIGSNTSGTFIDPWLDKYIFPGALLPSIKQIGHAIEGLFVMEDWHNFSADYDRTLVAWHDNFVKNWDALSDRYDEMFFRMWRYYLLMCAGTFRARKNQLWQIVLSSNGVPGGYESIR
jgi:cyclopropane-fatty-acyl-phospholipid synthase